MIIYGIDYKRFNALSQGFIFRDGRPFEAADEAIADDIIAQTRHLKVGDTVTLINHPFKIFRNRGARQRRAVFYSIEEVVRTLWERRIGCRCFL